EDGIRDFHVTGVQTCLFRSRAGTPRISSAVNATCGGACARSPLLFHPAQDVCCSGAAIGVSPFWRRAEPTRKQSTGSRGPYSSRSEERRVGKESRVRGS